MTIRTPSANGLTVAPNAPATANDPAASAQEVQQPQFWGRWALITQLPNVGVADGSVVVGVNPAAGAAYDAMRPGDIALVVTQPYWLVSRGTAGGNDAEWRSYASNAEQIATINSNYNLTSAVQRVYMDRSIGSFQIQLPDPALSRGLSWALEFIDDLTLVVDLVRFGAERIQGFAGTRAVRAPYGAWILSCDGTDWWLQGQNRVDLVFTSLGNLTVQAGWVAADVYIRAGAGGGAAGGNGGAGASGATAGGGGGGRSGGAGGVAVGQRRELILPTPGTLLTLAPGAGGAGAAAGSGLGGGTGSASFIDDGANVLLQAGRSVPAAGATGGAAGAAGTAAAGATGGAGGASGGGGGTSTPAGWGYTSGGVTSGGAGGNAGANGTNTPVNNPSPTVVLGPWAQDQWGSTALSGLGGAQSGGTHGGGGGGAAGATSTQADEFSPSGVASAQDDGRGGRRLVAEANGGAGNSAGAGVDGNNGSNGNDGTNGRGGGGGQGGGGGGGGLTAGGAGGVGGGGGNGSDGLIVITVWD